MKIYRVKTYKEMCDKISEEFVNDIIENPSSVLGLATGSTALGIYENLINKHKQENLDFSFVKTVNLDEYIGLSNDNDQSYRYYMDNNFFNHINVKKENTFIPNGLAKDLKKECDAYDELIQKLNGIDIQLLGIGHNGHIGFNEPNNSFKKDTHVVDLHKETIEANSRFFSSIEETPTTAITLGIKNIIQAKKVILAGGEDKKEIIEKAIFGDITPEVPASILQLHENLIVVMVD